MIKVTIHGQVAKDEYATADDWSVQNGFLTVWAGGASNANKRKLAEYPAGQWMKVTKEDSK